MVSEHKIKLAELSETIILSNDESKSDFFRGFTTKKERDINNVEHEFLDEEDMYYKVTDIFDGGLYMREGRVVDILMSIPRADYEDGDIYAHGYPESRLVPQNHGADSEEAFVEGYIENFSEVLREKFSEIITTSHSDFF